MSDPASPDFTAAPIVARICSIEGCTHNGKIHSLSTAAEVKVEALDALAAAREEVTR